jgi:hypothetical protein
MQSITGVVRDDEEIEWRFQLHADPVEPEGESRSIVEAYLADKKGEVMDQGPR